MVVWLNGLCIGLSFKKPQIVSILLNRAISPSLTKTLVFSVMVLIYIWKFQGQYHTWDEDSLAEGLKDVAWSYVTTNIS